MTVTGGMTRPPFPRDGNVDLLLGKAQAVAREIGITLESGPRTGGGSDGNFTAALGVPTLDGLGVDGEGAHTHQEYMLVSSVEPGVRVFQGCSRRWPDTECGPARGNSYAFLNAQPDRSPPCREISSTGASIGSTLGRQLSVNYSWRTCHPRGRGQHRSARRGAVGAHLACRPGRNRPMSRYTRGHQMNMAFAAAFTFLVIYAVISDVTRLRIPNWVSAALIALFVAFLAIGGKSLPVAEHVLVAACVLAGGFALFGLGWMGAGDVKLMAAVALWAGPSKALTFLLVTGIAGAALALE